MTRWGMVIDTDVCTGCEACVVACVPEDRLDEPADRRLAIGARHSRQGEFPVGETVEPTRKSRQCPTSVVHPYRGKAFAGRMRTAGHHPHGAALDRFLHVVVAVHPQTLHGEEQGARHHSATIRHQVQHAGTIYAVSLAHTDLWQ